MAELDDALSEQMWVEVEVHEDEDGLNCYSGLANRKQIEAILAGDKSVQGKFLQLDHVYWIRSTDETEWKKATREVVEYGKGRYGNHQGSIYILVGRIVIVSPLKGGADLQRKYIGQ